MMSLFNKKDREKAESLTKAELPYIVGMIVLDIAAPIFLMLGISYGSSANASLLGNFEIVATTVIALILFKEAVTKRLWVAIGLITLSSILLSFEGTDSFHFSYGSLLVIMATVCWGLENNCTRELSSKSTYQIVMLKRPMLWSWRSGHCSDKKRVLSRNRLYRHCLGFRFCSLRTQHFHVCESPECSWSS